MYLENKHYGTFPLIAHNPFTDLASCPLWNKLLKFPIRKINLPDDLTIVTWNHSDAKGLLENQLDSQGISYLCLGKGCSWTTNRLKPKTLLDQISNIKTKYILGADCFDVVIVDSLVTIIDRFLAKKCRLLYNATGTVYPYDESHKDKEEKLCQSPFQFFNSGLFIGETIYVKVILQQLDLNDVRFSNSDQYLIRQLYHRFFPEIQIDWNCEIFQIMYLKDYKIEDYLKLNYRLL